MRADLIDQHDPRTARRRWVVVGWILGGVAVFAMLVVIAGALASFTPRPRLKAQDLRTAAVHWPEDIIPLINAGHDVNALFDGETALSQAVTFGKVDSVQLLLSHGADPDLCGPGKSPPLGSVFLHYDNPRSLQIIHLLLDAGVDPNVRGVFGRTPLHQALQEKQESLVYRLLDAQADVNMHDEVPGQTPLHLAAANSRPEVIRRLLAAGAEIDAQDNSHTTPLMVAIRAQRQDVVELLLEAGADASLPGWSPDYAEREAGTPEIRELLRKHRESAGATTP
jgi:ankyrin repeat protein